MMAALDVPGKAPIDVLIVSESSRIGRDTTYFPYYLNKIEDNNVQVWAYLKKERISVATETAQVQTLFAAMGASYESKRARERSLDELSRRARAGAVAGGKLYGFTNHRPRPGARVERIVNEDQKRVIVRIFILVADGWGYARIARQLNAEKIPGPRTLGLKAQAALLEAGEPIPAPTWSLSGVREILDRRLYVTGEHVWGLSQRSRKKGAGLRLKRAADDPAIVRVQREEWKIVPQELWDRAHARIDATSAKILRAGAGVGDARTRFVGKPEQRGKYLLCSFLVCGLCGSSLIGAQRGRARVHAYICSGHLERGGTVCTNGTAVPMLWIDTAVVAAIQSEFTREKFEALLQTRATDTAQIAEYQGQRARLIDVEMPRLAKTVERLTRRLGQVDDDEVAATVLAELKAAVQERKAVEARVAELETYVMGLKDQAALVERLSEVWGGSWAGALSSDPAEVVKARQVLKKILEGTITVIPTGPRAWQFFGRAHFDGALHGVIDPLGYTVRPEVGRKVSRPWNEEPDGPDRDDYQDAVEGLAPDPPDGGGGSSRGCSSSGPPMSH